MAYVAVTKFGVETMFRNREVFGWIIKKLVK